MPKPQWFYVDRRTCIVMRYNKAVKLGVVQFAIFDALHRLGTKEGKQMPSADLCDEVYRGARNPSTMNTIHACVSSMNRKLQHVGLKVRGVNRREHSFYQIVVL